VEPDTTGYRRDFTGYTEPLHPAGWTAAPAEEETPAPSGNCVSVRLDVLHFHQQLSVVVPQARAKPGDASH
jgi:hypothetical protein